MMPYKRPAADKSGVPVYQPNATTYQQLMQLQQPFVPVSCEYSVSPAPAPATSTASSPTDEPQSVTVSAASQLPQISKEGEVASTASTPVTVPSIPTQAITDPATLAKEVAQQNYAKAVKLAAVNQSLAATNPLSHLNPLNYTGIALNKQTMNIPPPAIATAARYPTLSFGLGAAGLGLGLNPYSTALPQASFLNIARPPTQIINPYSFIRNPYAGATTSPQLITPGAQYLGAQYPVSVAATPITNVPSSNNIAAAVAQNNNNNVVVQPYKKLKTT